MEKDKPEKKKIDRRKITTPQNCQGGLVNVSHGGYHFLNSGLVPCDKCLFKENGCHFYKPGADCAVIKAYREEKTNEIMALSWIKPHHIGTVQNYVKLRALAMVIEKWIASPKIGLFTSKKGRGLDVQPVMKIYGFFINAQERLAERLCLTPLSQRMAGVDSEADKNLNDHLKDMEVKVKGETEDEKQES